jgi:hypothetical protein
MRPADARILAAPRARSQSRVARRRRVRSGTITLLPKGDQATAGRMAAPRFPMPRRAFAARTLIPFAILTLLISTGCTAIGFGVGAVSDMKRGKGPASRLVEVPRGREVTVWLNDGRQLTGAFMGHEEARAPAAADSASILRTMILLETKAETLRIPVGDVDRVSVPVISGKVTGALVGVLIDGVVVVLVFISYLSQMN